MNGFENYSMTSWMVDGLARHPPTRSGRNAPRTKRAPMVASLFLPLVAITSMQVLSSPFQVRSNTKIAMELGNEGLASDLISGQPEIVWPKIVSTIRMWDTVKESEQADPPPLI